MKKLSMILVAAVVALAMLLTACGSVSEVTGIEFDKVPKSNYSVNENALAKDFSVKIFYADKDPVTVKLTDSRLQVTGLDGDKLDTKTEGLKTIEVTYRGDFTISFSYYVGDNTALWTENLATPEGWNAEMTSFENVSSAEQLAYIAKIFKGKTFTGTITFVSNAEIDLIGKQWYPIENFAGIIVGNGATIKNLTITEDIGYSTSPTLSEVGRGFIGKTSGATTTIGYLNFEDTVILRATVFIGDDNKNFGALIGETSGTVTINNVNVKNAEIAGNGRIGGIVGVVGGTVTINNSKVEDSSFTAYNAAAGSTDDGNGDKVGGLVGQSQGTLNINTSVVEDIEINGTRDLGGLVGYTLATTIANSSVTGNTVISANITGGMSVLKGARNLGGLVGTYQGNADITKVPLFTIDSSNTVAASVQILEKDSYSTISSVGKYLGGFRLQGTPIFKVVIGGTTYVIKGANGNTASNYTNLATLKDAQEAVVNYITSKIDGGSVAKPTAPTPLGDNYCYVD